MKKIFALITLFIAAIPVFAQEQVEMADKMRADGHIYVVVGTISIVFIGLAVYLFMMDSRLKKLEKDS